MQNPKPKQHINKRKTRHTNTPTQHKQNKPNKQHTTNTKTQTQIKYTQTYTNKHT